METGWILPGIVQRTPVRAGFYARNDRNSTVVLLFVEVL
jgi:hypothetical protein